MNKLSRREFTELLIEWKNNFISERSIHSFRAGEGFEGEISDFGKSVLKKLNYPAHLITIPVPDNNYQARLENVFPNVHEKYNIYKKNSMSAEDIYILEKSEFNYNLIKKDIIEFYKASSNEEYEEYDLGKPNEYGDVQDSAYGDLKFSLQKGYFSKKEITKDLEVFFNEIKSIMCGSKDDDLPCFLSIHTSYFSYEFETSTGGLFKISKLSEDTQESFLKWLFSHDFMHLFGTLARQFKKNKNNYKVKLPDNNPEEHEDKGIDCFFKVKGMEESFLTGDNSASVYSQIIYMSEQDALNFLENTHVSRKELQDIVENKKNHEYSNYFLSLHLEEDYLTKILESEEEFNKFKKDNINKVLISLIENVKPAVNKWFEYFKNKIIIIDGKLT